MTSDFRPKVEMRPFRACAVKKNMQWPLFMAESPKFSRHKENWGRHTPWGRQILDRKWKYGHFVHATMHPAIIIGTVRSL